MLINTDLLIRFISECCNRFKNKVPCPGQCLLFVHNSIWMLDAIYLL